MSATTFVDRSWVRSAGGIIFVMVLLSPVAAWAAAKVNYAEPLANVAEMTGAADAATAIISGVLPGYTVPGLGTYVGTFVSGLVGVAVVFGLTIAIGYTLE